MMSLIGETIGNYRIDALIGVGGMGEVYHGVHVHLDRPAAIKIMHPHLAADPGFQARFRQEARAAARLDHPGIVQILDFGQQEERYFLVMELVTDGSVRTLLRQGPSGSTPLDLPTGLNLIRQAAEALAYAHEQGMIHRDIKPDNLLLRATGGSAGAGRDYQVKICDFGLARLAEGSVLTASGVMMGTPAYMSPEQCQGLALDARSDQYSLGVVLYQVATGRLPFDIKTPTEAAFRHVFTEPAAPRDLAPGLPVEVDRMILRCLAKHASDRFASMDELGEALRDAIHNSATLPARAIEPHPQPVAAPADTLVARKVTPDAPLDASTPPPPPAIPLADDRPVDDAPGLAGATVARQAGMLGRLAGLPVWLLALAVVVVVALGVGGGLWLRDGGSAGEQPTGTTASTSQPDATQFAGVAPLAEGPGTITFTMGDDVYRMTPETGATPENVSQALDALAPGTGEKWLNVSPDGEWLLIETDRFDEECSSWPCLSLVPRDLSSGEAVQIGEEFLHPNGFSAVASGGNLIVFPNDQGHQGPHEADLWVTVRRDGQWTEATLLTGESPYAWHSNPALSADGKRVVFDCGRQPNYEPGSSICEVATDGSGFRVAFDPASHSYLFEPNATSHHPAYAPSGAIVFEVSGGGEHIWQVQNPGAEPTPLMPDFDRANSPCVLPDGSVVILWIVYHDQGSSQELKVIAPNGTDFSVILSAENIKEDDIGCGA
jgi:serine/threonine protein kinase